MKAATYDRYGAPEAVVRIADVPRPEPAPDEVLIRVAAASVNYVDVQFVRGRPKIVRLALGWPGPKVERVGMDVAGTVEAVGERVTRFAPGDAVFGTCRGAFADYVCTTERRLAAKPASVGFAEAASLPIAGLTALQGLRDRGGIGPGQKVLVIGAGGGIGTFAVQIARAHGAEVTAVCSGSKAELVRSLGASRVIDYAKEDFTETARGFDLVLDIAGVSFGRTRRVLKPGGILAPAGLIGAGYEPGTLWLIGFFARVLGSALTSRWRTTRFAMVSARARPEDLATLAGMVAAGQVKPAITRRYRLDEAAEAMRHLAGGHAAGKLIVEIG